MDDINLNTTRIDKESIEKGKINFEILLKKKDCFVDITSVLLQNNGILLVTYMTTFINGKIL